MGEPCRIAVTGKGGTGKTTLASLLAASLIPAGTRPILAVDADPNANLHEALGRPSWPCGSGRCWWSLTAWT
ncbi:MAG: acsF [Methanomicrobia archaeon]|nr:acsF [Methanomicrobia archaeon]